MFTGAKVLYGTDKMCPRERESLFFFALYEILSYISVQGCAISSQQSARRRFCRTPFPVRYALATARILA